ncbi:NADH dehydrogenase FAD-containing subunit [Microlunatus elymi]|uniref:NADH dehydrogenase FAD-containing subunit n=1 Tax=Microlunatus elymi TaxID=2596828 RepID=A0A516Q0E5_9ACTN|nr:FAD-dependent oxidoreductase [Microlunatus elymi]QDP96909.1 NADH dehydrogenase FAD-containing subunit [Microlunatus elymi]
MADEVLVLGGGLAGVATALRLGDEGIPVTLVDRNDYHQFQPLLYQVASSQLPAEDVARPHRSIFNDYPSVQLVNTEVEQVDLDQHRLGLADGRTLTGAELVLAAGARPNFFGVPGAAEYGFPLYSVVDAERLRSHLRRLLDGAFAAGGDDDGKLDVVVVGGGPTGVEITGALAELMAELHRTGRLTRMPQITIVDRGPALLLPFPDKAHAYTSAKLTEHGASIRLSTGVTAIRQSAIDLDDGSTLSAGTTVWAAGEQGPAVVASAGSVLGRGGRVDVRSDLTVNGYPGVYAVGDVANIPSTDDGDAALPQLGSVAQQSGRWAAENILRERRQHNTESFRYKDKGIMAMIGRNAAVAAVGKRHHQVEGPVAFGAWLGVHAMLLSGAHSKVDAFLTWAEDYFDRDHSAALESSAQPQRIAWSDDELDRPHIVMHPRRV